MPEFLQQVVGGIGVVANAISVTTGAITILGIAATLLGYLTGRRNSLFERSSSSANEALLAEMRQGFAAVMAAITTPPGEQVPLQDTSPEAVLAPVPAPAPAPAPSAPATPHPPVSSPVPSFAPPPGYASFPQFTSVPPYGSALPPRAVKRWAKHPALAVWTSMAMALTLVGVVGVLITTPEPETQGTGLYTLLSLLMVIGFGLDIAVLIWACIVALRMGRWGWAAALFFGSAGLVVLTVFFLPASLILVFAVWGPNTPRTSPTKTQPAPGHPMFAPPGAPYPGYPPGNIPSSGMQARSPAPVGSMPYRPGQPPERPGGGTPQW